MLPSAVVPDAVEARRVEHNQGRGILEDSRVKLIFEVARRRTKIRRPMPQPSASKRLLIMLAQLPMISHLFAVSPDSTSDTYHIQIVSTGPCPPAFGGFCPTGTRVS